MGVEGAQVMLTLYLFVSLLCHLLLKFCNEGNFVHSFALLETTGILNDVIEALLLSMRNTVKSE